MLRSGAVYRIVNAKSGTALDLSGTDERSIIGWPKHDGDNQKWHVEENNGLYSLRNVRYGKYVGLESTHLKDAIKAIATENKFDWEVKQDEDDPTVFRFFVPGTVFNLDLSNHGSDRGGTPVEIWGKWEGRNQCWRLEQL
ncbi:carbohydrate-binding module family 13 protein [Amanita thiersii Skay4041]|uniref:Carbohydrate-binding module family 13 protein n=1 Tax=Amanita thiersii Skay4041 TaxID=703135 RepID=A0A2A9NIF6_9AGAR|nr:carbohydrate-binding module family 13 protein [Amanita thiersii Skay4041]